MSLKNTIIDYAHALGADLVGVARPKPYDDYLCEVNTRLDETQAQGKDFMLGSKDALSFFEGLAHAKHGLARAQSILILGAYSFDQVGDYSETRENLLGKTARTYAYYPVVRQIAEQLVQYLNQHGYQAVQGQQIPLKYVAQSIGLGTYGYNGLLFTEKLGSFVALRAVITNAELEPDHFTAPKMPCQSCGRCLKACPTGALYAPYKVNPARCINPLTRKEDDIPESLCQRMGNWVCGCDICQEICPLNRSLTPRVADPRARFDPEHHASHSLLAGLARTPDLRHLVETSHTVMKRNALIALRNIGSEEALCILRSNDDRV
jgi:epoxyqueuosine reductase